jgi:hypothetical protein
VRYKNKKKRFLVDGTFVLFLEYMLTRCIVLFPVLA